MASRPVTYYRLWCGRKKHSAWLTDKREVWRIAVAKGLAFADRDGNAGLGPLTWIEQGERRYARSRTVPVDPMRPRR